MMPSTLVIGVVRWVAFFASLDGMFAGKAHLS